MIVLFLVVGILVLLAAALLWTGRWSSADRGLQREGTPDYPAPGSWSAQAVHDARFRVGLRGYRMEDVDAMLSSLAAQLERQSAAAPADQNTPSERDPQ